MARRACDFGLEYLAITDHSRRVAMAHGLTPARLREQRTEIDRVAGQLKGITLLRGIEVDILDDGTLDFAWRCTGGTGLGGGERRGPDAAAARLKRRTREGP